MEEEQRVLTELAFLAEVIFGQYQQKLKENQDVGRFTEVAVLKINETNKIRERYRALCEIPETEKEKDVNKRQEVGKEWEAMGEISEVNSADQIGKLEALRFKMEPKNSNLSRLKARKFWKMKCLECGRQFERKKLTINMATRPGKLKSRQWENTGILNEFIARKFRLWGRW